MNREEMIEQINNLIESWYLKEADLNQEDIDSIKYLLEENERLKNVLSKIEEYMRKNIDAIEKEKSLLGDNIDLAIESELTFKQFMYQEMIVYMKIFEAKQLP